jgi:hypothetical protein
LVVNADLRRQLDEYKTRVLELAGIED